MYESHANKSDPQPSSVEASSLAKYTVWVAAIFACVFVVTAFIVVPKIEHRLDSGVHERLRAAGVDSASLNFDWDYRNLTVSGFVPSGLTIDELTMIIRDPDSNRSTLFARGIRRLSVFVDDGTLLTGGTGEKFSIDVQSDGSVATLSGLVQTESQREQLVQAVRDAGVFSIFDYIDVIGIETSESIEQRVGLVVEMLRLIGPGQTGRSEITVNESEMRYQVSAKNKHTALAVQRVASRELEGFDVIGNIDMLSNTSLNISAVTDGEKLTLAGKIVSQTQRNRLLFAANEAVGASNVIDQLTLLRDASESNVASRNTDIFAGVVSRLSPGIKGDVMLLGDELSVTALVANEDIRQYLLPSVLQARAAGLDVSEEIKIRLTNEATVNLQREFDAIKEQVRRRVVFETGTSILSADAKQMLSVVTGILKEHPDLLVEIEGHTDNVGRESVNEALSQARANAVRNHLASQSIDANRLIAIGYGPRRPIESNDTTEGRSVNRRVQFTVLKRPK